MRFLLFSEATYITENFVVAELSNDLWVDSGKVLQSVRPSEAPGLPSDFTRNAGPESVDALRVQQFRNLSLQIRCPSWEHPFLGFFFFGDDTFCVGHCPFSFR